jgi:hypothetical protein
MSGTNIKLSGGSAVLFLIIALGFGGFRYGSARASLDTDAAATLKVWLRAEYSGRLLRAAGAGTMDEEQAQDLLAMQDIRLLSIKGRGRPSDMVVRVEIAVGDKVPPDGRPVRYYRMHHSQLTGWVLDREVTALSYHLNFF